MSRRPLVPEAKEKLDELKTEFGNEIGMELHDYYEGNRTSRANGYIGGHVGGLMTKKMIEEYEKKLVHK